VRNYASILAISMILICQASAKVVDLSTKSDSTGDYDIAFCARPSPDTTGKPGHAFVAFSHRAADGTRDFFAIGHTVGVSTSPVSATWSYWGAPIPGRLKEERYTAIKQSCLDAKVDRKDYDNGIALTEDPLVKLGLSRPGNTVFESYKLGADDCMTFMISVANSLKAKGLKVPKRGSVELPMEYMRRFIDSN
jgi:hypothetical protein